MIVWSPLAAKDYEGNIEFLLNRWTHKEAVRFIQVTDSILKIIDKSPKTFGEIGYREIRAVVIPPQITLYYRLENSGNISLIRFWNNHQNPEKLELG